MSAEIARSPLVGQFARFVAVGGSNLVLTYGVYLLALGALPPVISILIAFVAGLAYMALLNIRYVFRRPIRPRVLAGSITYYTLYGTAYAVLLDTAVRWLSVPPELAPIPVLCIALPAHFLLSRWLITRLAETTHDAPWTKHSQRS